MSEIDHQWQIPQSPIDDFNALQDKLRNELAQAKEAHARSEDARIQQRLEQLDEAEIALEQAQRQQRSLEQFERDFAHLGDFGEDGRTSVTGHLATLKEHIALLDQTLAEEEFVQAKELRRKHSQTLSDELEGILQRGDTEFDPGLVVGHALRLAQAAGYDLAIKLMTRFETELAFLDDLAGLRAAHRFWLDVARSPAVQDTATTQEARKRHRELKAELTRREAETEAITTIKSLCEEIHGGVDYLDQLGPQEQVVQINIWAGKLRRYQDGTDLPPEVDNQLYHTFGAINSARKRLIVDGYIEPLNRTVSYDWDDFVDDWEAKREAARLSDEARKDEVAAAQERETHRQQLAEKQAEQAGRDLEALKCLLGESDPRRDPVVLEAFHDLATDCVENDACRLDEFLELVAPHSDLVATGREYRSLRRSLQKRDLWPEGVQQFEPPETNRLQSVREELTLELAPILAGKRVLILGGKPRAKVKEVLTQTFNLETVDWPDGWDHQLDLDALGEGIRRQSYDAVILLVRFVGHYAMGLKDVCHDANVAWVMLDKGCGITGMLRAIKEQASGMLSEGAKTPG